MRRGVGWGLALVLVVGLARCGPPPEPADDGVLKLGVLGPFSGPDAAIGEEFRLAAELALEAIDYQIGTTPIEAVWIDSQSDPGRAAQAYERAVLQDDLDAGVLNWDSAVAIEVMELSARHRVPHFFGFGSTGVINDRIESDPETYGYWTTKGWPDPLKLTGIYVSALEDAIEAGIWEPEQKTAAIYGEDTDWGRSFGEDLADQLELAGWEIEDRVYFPLTWMEFAPVLDRLAARDPALIAGTLTAPDQIAAFLLQAGDFGADWLIIADGLGGTGAWSRLPADSTEGVIDQSSDWSTEELRALSATFAERGGPPAGATSGALAYDGMNYFIRVLQATNRNGGELTSEAIYRTVREQVWTGDLTFTVEDGAIVMLEYDFRHPPDPLVGADYFALPVVQYRDGSPVRIWPERIAESDLKVPQ